MQLELRAANVNAVLQDEIPSNAIWIAWLGQAGFLVRTAQVRLFIDPYLSDHLADKYAGADFPHDRLMKAPVDPRDVRGLDLVLCTHRHSDHMDPDALPVLAAGNPRCRFIVPRAERDHAMKMGLAADRLIGVDDGDRIEPLPGLTVSPVPAAHEELRTNDRGENHFLGFVLQIGSLTIYHSGDTVRYSHQANRLRPYGIDVALLPVNGRRPELTQRGFAGNMSFEEARDLCRELQIGVMVPHHFGMFAFNTVPPEELARKVAASTPPPSIILPTPDHALQVTQVAASGTLPTSLLRC